MAVGTVSGVDPSDNWQLIATNTPSAASTSTFSSISGYRKLMLVFKYTTSAAGCMIVRFNGDSTNGNYASYQSFYTNGANYSQTYINLGVYGYTTQIRTGYIEINNVDKSMPHPINGTAWEGSISGLYFDSNPITSIVLSGEGGGTISGTIHLYGIAA